MMFRSTFWLQVSGLRRVLRTGLWFGPLLAGLVACQNNDCLKSAGDTTTERRELPAFTDISAADNVNLTLVQDTDTYAEVTTGAHLQSDLKLEVRGNTLYVTNESRCNWARSYDVPHEATLHLPQLRNMYLLGQGNISTQGQFVADTLFCHLTGSGDYDLDVRSNYVWLDQYELGDYRLRGTTDQLLLSGGGLGRFFALDMQARECYLSLTRFAAGAIYVNAANTLAGTSDGRSTIYYTGNPSYVGVTFTGEGRLERQ